MPKAYLFCFDQCKKIPSHKNAYVIWKVRIRWRILVFKGVSRFWWSFLTRDLGGDGEVFFFFFFLSSQSSLPPRTSPKRISSVCLPHPQQAIAQRRRWSDGNPHHWHGGERGYSDDGDDEIELWWGGIIPYQCAWLGVRTLDLLLQVVLGGSKDGEEKRKIFRFTLRLLVSE